MKNIKNAFSKGDKAFYEKKGRKSEREEDGEMILGTEKK